MKKLFSFVAAALMSASMFAGPATTPTVQDVVAAGYDQTKRVIVLYFDEQVCNDIVWAGSYNEWATGTPAEMLHFEALEGFDGWYVVEVDDARTPQIDQTDDTGNKCCVGKPIQLKKDGTLDWKFQAGDKDAWLNMAQPGTQTHYIYGGYAGEADICWNEYGVYIYEVAYFKEHNTPCGEEKPKHDYTFTVYMPEFCDEIAVYADSVFIMGDFDWDKGVEMELKYDEEFNPYYYAEIKELEEGSGFKFRCGTMGWDVQPQLNGADLPNMITTAKNDTVIYLNGEGYGFKACPAAVEYKYTEYVNWQLKHEGSGWEWTENLVKVGEGLFKLAEADWTGSGFNVGSDENPIKKDWFAPEELVLGEEVIAPVTVDVYLKVVDDETVILGVGVEPTTGIENVTLNPAIRRVMIDGHVYINNNGKLINMLGF